MKPEVRLPVFFEAKDLKTAIVWVENYLSHIDDSRPFLIVNALEDKNQHRFLGQEINSVLLFYNELVPVNNLLSVIPAVNSGEFVFFAYAPLSSSPPLCAETVSFSFYRDFFNPLLISFVEKKRCLVDSEEDIEGCEPNFFLQSDALEWVVKESLKSDGSKIFYIQGRRGVGKSFLSGLIVKQLSQKGFLSVLSGPSRSSVKNILKAFPSVKYMDFYLLDKWHENYFMLIIDEIAAIGESRGFSLARERAKKGLCTLLVGTIEGYEGDYNYTLLKEEKEIGQTQLNISNIFLDEGYRFSYKKDWLSHFCDAIQRPWGIYPLEKGSIERYLRLFHVKQGCYIFSLESLGKDCLCVLSWMYRLLSESHYRSSPNDFWRFINQSSIFAVKVFEGQIIAVCQSYIDEFDVKEVDSEKVFFNQRRSKGALTQQSIYSSYVGVEKDFLQRKVLRVSRVVTIKKYRREGFASQLISLLEDYAKQNKMDYLSVSFAMLENHYAFWRSNGFIGARLSIDKNKRTKKETVLMLKAIKNSPLIKDELDKINCFFIWFVRCIKQDYEGLLLGEEMNCSTWNNKEILSKSQIRHSLNSVFDGFRAVGWVVPEVIVWLEVNDKKKEWVTLGKEVLGLFNDMKNQNIKQRDEAVKRLLHSLRNDLEKY